MPEILTPDSSRWQEFISRLKGPEGISLRMDTDSEPSGLTWVCEDNSRSRTTAILKSMRGIDVEATLKYFSSRGGCCCDCEVYLNVT